MTADSFVFPASFAQQRLWFLHLLEPENASYNIAGAVRLRGTLDAGALQRALEALVERHESLRTTFAQEGKDPVQVIAEQGSLPLALTDLGAVPPAEREAEALRHAAEEARKPFDLERGPLLRARLLRLEPTHHVLVVVMHHIISDGWSLGILIREVSQLYAALATGREPALAPLPIQYADYAQWQRDWLSQEGALDRHVAYWKQQLAGAPVLQLPTDRPRPARNTQRGATLPVHLPASLVARLQELARGERCTLFMVLLAAYQALLARYTHQRDIVVGAPQNNRNRVQTEGLIGLFVNTLALRTDVSANPSFRELLQRVREVVLGAHAHQDLPFERLVDEVQPERNMAYTPLFQVAFNLQNMAPPEASLPGLSLEPVELHTGTSKFDLTLDLQESADGLHGVLEYNSDLFDRATVERLRGHLRVLLEAVVAHPERRLEELPLLTEGERHQLLEVWPALKPFPGEACLHHLFEAQVRRRPEAVAVVCEGESLTYAELDRRANRLAHALRERGVGPEVLVGLCVERSLAMVEGLLAILKAGAAYVPLDPTYPADRLAYMVQDSRMPLVLTQRHLVERLPEGSVPLLVLEEAAELLARMPEHAPQVSLTSDNLAYVIYTSGSTGRPKGSLLPHRNVTRLFEATEHWFHFGERDVWTLFHSYAFDFSVWELWGALLYGGRLVVVPYLTSRSPEAFYRLLGEQRVTVLNQTPAAFRQLIQAEERLGAQAPRLALRLVIFGGEALEPASLVPWFRRHGDSQPRLVNMYGITETTVHVTYRPMSAAEAEHTQQSPIGVAIPDLQLYVLDGRLEPVPVGVAGEIFVGGAGLARGYLGRPELTAERFVPHPFSREPGARLYRTGDLARFNAEGQLEYLGRIDFQVKIRGFRIELGEIQTVLSLHPGVREAVVLVHEDSPGHKVLVAYLTAHAQPGPSATELRQFLSTRLPDYMVPATFMLLEQMPLTSNGKVDRKALPAPTQAREEPGRQYTPPSTLVESTLCAIWSKVLGVHPVGIHDNFFALGGDSILSIQVLTLAQERGLRLSLQQLFQYQTVAELARAAEARQAETEEVPSTEPFSLVPEEDRARLPEGLEDAYPLARIQAGMLYHMELAPTSNIYHNTDTFHLRTRTAFNPELFEQAVQVVVGRHAVLRTAFDMTSYSEPLQLVHRQARLPVEVVDLRHLSSEEQEQVIARLLQEEKRRHFDLARPPLLRFYVHLRSERSFQFTLTECHAIIDGWSLHSSLVEMFNHYYALVNGQPPPQPEPTRLTYRDFVALEQRALASEAHQRYWRQALEGATPMRVPRWRRPLGGEPRIATVKVPIPPQLSEGLRALSQQAALPYKSILLTAHLKVMSLLCGQQEVLTGMGVNSRPEEGDGSKLRGLFLNTVPFRMRLPPGSWSSLVRATFAAERELYPYRRYPMADIQRQWGREPLYEVMFNYMHFHVLNDIAGTLAELETLDMTRSEGTNATLAAHFQTEPSTQELTLEFDYDSNELVAEQVEQIGACYARVLEALAFRSREPHHTFSPLPAEEQRRLLVEWNATAASTPEQATLQALLEAQVEATPHAVAVVDGERRLSYRELNEQANRLAWHLRGLGVGPERRVALCLERSVELLVGMLGALKAGAAYLPLDPAYPAERLAYMLEDSQAAVLLTSPQWRERLARPGLITLCLPQEQALLGAQPAHNPPPGPGGEALAYVIYTSGSTGRPKGTLLSHRGMMNYLGWATREYRVAQCHGAPVHTSAAFDATITSLFAPLLAGRSVYMVPSGKEVEALAQYLRQQQGPSLVKLTPAHLQLLADLLPAEALAQLESTFVVGGEALPASTVELWRRLAPRVRLINEYGPTETVVGCCVYDVSAAGVVEGSVPIGRPIANTELYVLDEHLQPLPVGVPGELYIGGAGVARGYHGRPELTAERFVPDPFSGRPGARLYRTGDLARYLPGGNLEFLGRRDSQVKLRGFRIELGEIEAQLQGAAGVEQAVVQVWRPPEGEPQLVAWVVAGEGTGSEELRRHLLARLPEYMVPSAFVLLPELPLTPNGKVDRKALPAPSAAERGAARYEAPATPTEQQLAALWQSLLGVERVGRGDHFFNLGGHSLLATRLVSRVRTALGVKLPLASLFEHPTLRELAAHVEFARAAAAGRELPPLAPAPRQGPLPLSFAQQRLWFIYRMDPGSPAYNTPVAFHLEGRVEVEALRRTLEEILHRHEVLRTRFHDEEGSPRQVILPASPFPLPVVELGAGAEQEALRLARQEAARPFDLTQGPLLRALLLQLGAERHVLVLTLHHIASDGWSMGVLVEEVVRLYQAFSAGLASPLPPLRLQYADFAAWQQQHLRGALLEELLAYWRQQLAGAPHALELPTDRARPAVQSSRGSTVPVHLSRELASSLQALAREQGSTLFMVLLSAFQVLLSRYSGQEDVVVGSPIAGRTQAEVEPLIGFFVNTLALRSRVRAEDSFLQLLAQVRATTLAAHEHQHLPFERLVEELQPERDLSRSPLFQVVFALQNAPEGELKLPQLTLRQLPVDPPASKFDLTLSLAESAQGLEGTLEYATDLFDRSTVERMVGHLQVLLRAVAANPQARLGELPLMSEAERRQVLVEWNDTWTDFPRHTPLHALVSAQAARSAGVPAVEHEGQVLTYAELELRSNQLAWHLRHLGVGRNTLVALFLERSVDMVVAMLATLKAGGAYLPLDPLWPRERLAFVFQDTRAPVVVSHGSLPQGLPPLPGPLVRLDEDAATLHSQPGDMPPNLNSPEDLAYVIYTSGSTGTPKGVAVTHLNVLRLCLNTHYVQATPRDCFAQLSNVAFDAATFEVWMPLLHGARLSILSRDVVLSAPRLAGALREKQVTSLFLTAALFNQVVREVPEAFAPVRDVLVGGEALDAGTVRTVLASRPPARLLNAYGPTETTTFATWHLISSLPEQATSVPIGRPLSNTRLYVLDERRQPVPVGVAGELYIGGEGVAQGYLHRPELTAERFVPDPFSSQGGAKLYRTGDRVKWNAEGQIEFLGRLDSQVKLRGFRVELGEVEAVLLQHPAVGAAVAVVREDRPGDKRLVAYVVARPGESLEPGTLRGFLQQRLPEYMLPALFMPLESLPLNVNGKVDKRALPAPGAQRQASGEYEPPRTEVERTLAALWAQVLGVEQVGIHDNFFELGGDSILSLQIIARASQAGLKLTPRQLFQHQTVAALARVATQASGTQAEQGVVEGELPLTPIQHWFFEWQLPQPHHFNQAVLLRLREPLEPGLLQQALQALVAHHDSLRLRFERTAEGWRAVNAGLESPVALRQVDLSHLEEGPQLEALEQEGARAQAGFHLEQPPLVAAVLFHLGPQRGSRLLLALHHLVVDAVSWRVLLEDLESACQQLRQGWPVALPQKTTSFQAWARRLEAYAQGAELGEELALWQAPEGSVAPLPVDEPGGANTQASARTLQVALEPEYTRLLLQEVPGAWRARIDEVLVAALAQALSAWTGQRRVRVQLEGHGREELFEDVDLTRTVGWFTTLSPVTLELPEGGLVGEELRAVRDALRRVPRKGLGYGLLRYLRRGEEARALRQQPEAEVGFNYLGQLDSALPASSLLQPAHERFGPTHGELGRRRQVLEVNAHVLAGRLEVDFTYSEALHRRSTVEALAQGYLRALRALVEQRHSPETARFSPADFPLARVEPSTLDSLVQAYPGLEDLYPLSPMQQGMLFHTLLAPGSGMYFEQAAWTLDTQLDLEALRSAWQQVVARYPILRTSFAWEELQEPLQVVHRDAVVPWSEEDWRGLPEPEQQARLQGWMEADSARGFDLKRAPLLRLAVLRLGERTWRLVWSFHHLLLDGWSLGRVLGEALALYEAQVRQQPLRLEAPPRFRDYIAWLQRQGTAQAEQWWRQALAGFSEPTPLPGESAGPARTAPQVLCETQRLLSAESTERLRAFARQHQVTLSTLVQAAWALVVGRYAGSEEVLFGLTVSGRPPELPGVEGMVGLFINTLPSRVRLPPQQRVADWLKQLQAWQVERQPHEYAPLVQVQGWSQVPRGTPLFENLFVFENYPVEESVRQGARGLEVREVAARERTNYPLTLTAHADRQLVLLLNYESPRLGAPAMERLLEQLHTVLEDMVTSGDRRLWELSLLTASERQRLLVEWNDTRAELPAEPCLHQLISARARSNPEALAVVAPGSAPLTYRQLEERSNQLAWHLRSRGVGPEVLVGVYLERSVELIVALLGILKAGGAYAPLDPSYPSERVALMVAEAGLSLLLTDKALAPSLPAHSVPVYRVDEEQPQRAALPTEPPDTRASNHHLAYTVFTSGSTGTPKGVMVSHRSWVNAYLGWERSYELRERCRSHLQMASFSFDVFAGDLARALGSGGKLVLCPREWLLEPARLYELMRQEQVDCAEFVPAVLRGLLQHLEQSGQRLDFMRVLIAGSDAWYVSEYLQIRNVIGPGTRLINSYGVSEATIDTTWFESEALQPGEDRLVPIGRPFANDRVYILDGQQQPVPVGIPGELYIGGEGVARGYRGRPELTAERFVPDPFGEPGARLYRTGDRARYLEDGSVEFLGRVDTQVKLRGFRVELGEIESVLGRHPLVRAAVVALRAHTQGLQRLVAYVVGAPGLELAALREFLRERLPEYMVPSAFVPLEALPLTPNGKVDRKALPEPEGALREAQAQVVAPRTPTEEQLLAIWCSVLGRQSLSVVDDFFDVGGHSLLATQIISRVNAAFQVKLPLRALFEHPTLAALADRVVTAQLEQVEGSTLEQLLAEVEGLSEEELERQLEEVDE